jgi:hypothetical protein
MARQGMSWARIDGIGGWIQRGSPGIPVVTGQNSLSRRARPLEILGRPLNDVLFSREFRESLQRSQRCVTEVGPSPASERPR